MSFFNQMKNTLTSTTQDVTQKAKDTAQIAMLGNKVKQNETVINNLIHQIGQLYYDQYRENYSDEFTDLFLNIQRIQEDILQKQDEIRRLKEGTNCPNCGNSMNANEDFCTNCGFKVDRASSIVNMETRQAPEPLNENETITPPPSQAILNNQEETFSFCSTCGNKIDENAVFCNQCGSKTNEDRGE